MLYVLHTTRIAIAQHNPVIIKHRQLKWVKMEEWEDGGTGSEGWGEALRHKRQQRQWSWPLYAFIWDS